MKSVRFAFKQILPFIFSYFFVGIASGMLLREAGYSPVWAFLSAALIYAGSMQIVMVTLMTSGAPLYMVAILTLFINARHVFYGIGFVEEFRNIGRQKKSFWKYPYMALTMTDETYSLLCSLEYPADVVKQKVQFYVLFLCHMIWIGSCTLGAFMGDLLPFDMAGIEFSATIFFTLVVFNQWRETNAHASAIIGFICAIACLVIFGADSFILPALSLSVIVLTLTRKKISPMAGGSLA